MSHNLLLLCYRFLFLVPFLSLQSVFGFIYCNEEEWNNLLQAYEIYKDTVGEEVRYSTDKKEYVGPQFGRELEKMHAVINENYKYSDNFNKKQM